MQRLPPHRPGAAARLLARRTPGRAAAFAIPGAAHMQALLALARLRRAMGEVTVLTDADFEQFTSQGGVVLVDFWAPWCGPCKRIAPIIDELSSEMQDVRFAKLNTDENQAIAMKQGIMSIPTLLVYKDGQKVDQIVGAVPKDHLASTLKKHT